MLSNVSELEALSPHPLIVAQDLAVWKDRHDQLNETGNFLTATSRSEVAREIRDALDTVNSKWDRVFQVRTPFL